MQRDVESGEDSLTEDNDRLRYDSAHCVYMRYCVFVCTEHRSFAAETMNRTAQQLPTDSQ